jgi:hypothetical protein
LIDGAGPPLTVEEVLGPLVPWLPSCVLTASVILVRRVFFRGAFTVGKNVSTNLLTPATASAITPVATAGRDTAAHTAREIAACRACQSRGPRDGVGVEGGERGDTGWW